jgi:hypothetical protein
LLKEESKKEGTQTRVSGRITQEGSFYNEAGWIDEGRRGKEAEGERDILSPVLLDKSLSALSNLPRFVVVRAEAGRLGPDEEAKKLREVGRIITSRVSDRERPQRGDEGKEGRRVSKNGW